MEEGTRTRLLKFLVKDKMGMRKCLLSLFLQAKNYTTCDVYYHLRNQGFMVNYRMVSAMVGQMHTRLGILRIYLNREHNVYSLKESHRDIVMMVLSNPGF
jgi:hypothetical protein